MRKRTWIIVISLTLVVIVLLALKGAGVLGKDEGVRVATEKVQRRTITETVNASGKIYPEIEVKVSPDISGEIVELNVQEGDSVKRGDVLVKIYADIYTTQRDQASAMVGQERARVENLRAQLPGLKSAMNFAKLTYDRQKQLLDEKVISRSEFEQALGLKHVRKIYIVAFYCRLIGKTGRYLKADALSKLDLPSGVDVEIKA